MVKENGSLDLCVADQTAGDRVSSVFVGYQIFYDEWDDLFYNVLRAPRPESFKDGEDFLEYERRQRKRFESDLQNKGYPLLARIQDIYMDVEFQSDEVALLRAECVRVEERTENSSASHALEKIIRGCDAAIAEQSGLAFVSD